MKLILRYIIVVSLIILVLGYALWENLLIGTKVNYSSIAFIIEGKNKARTEKNYNYNDGNYIKKIDKKEKETVATIHHRLSQQLKFFFEQEEQKLIEKQIFQSDSIGISSDKYNYDDVDIKNQQSQHRRRNLNQHLDENDSNTLPFDMERILRRRIFTIECQSKPLFVCPTCDEKNLLQEQKEVISSILSRFPSARIVSTTRKISNAIFLELSLSATSPNEATVKNLDYTENDVIILLQNVPGVKRVNPHRMNQIQLDESVPRVEGTLAKSRFCRTGKNITVGVLDTGIDYTHNAFGGVGTVIAYRQAYGIFRTDPENTVRDGLFPTERIIDGIDFLGEVNNATEYQVDDDPIDGHGHGTQVASAIVAVAPDVQLVAVKVCATARSPICPDFAIIQGIEYLLDRNDDGRLDDGHDKIDIINLSIGSTWNSAYYESVADALERASSLGVLVITSIGNGGNIPYVAGAVGTTPNVFAVGATIHPRDSGPRSIMEDYSARGPGENNIIKPDIAAPSGSLMALLGTGTRYRRSRGTSFAAPLVTGGACLLLERCRDCSPFSIKSILMNTANRDVKYNDSSTAAEDDNDGERAPISLMGSGELQISKALDADFWAYSLEDVQPSLSLGLVDVVHDVVFTRTILVKNLEHQTQLLKIRTEFRDREDEKSGALTITFDSDTKELPDISCNNAEVQFAVSFHVNAALAPPNFMVSGGLHGTDGHLLDYNEFDGHIVIESTVTGKDIALPFHILLRKAANIQVDPSNTATSNVATLPSTPGPFTETFTITNHGAGVAQIDTFELLYQDIDRPESPYGSENTTADIRSIGYRTIPTKDDGNNCDYVVEFLFHTWERSRHVGLAAYVATVSLSSDFESPISIFSPTVPITRHCFLMQSDGNTTCTGFPPDHSTNTANTIIRACSNDLGLIAVDDDQPNEFHVLFSTYAFPLEHSIEQVSDIIQVPFPTPRISARPYNVGPNEILNSYVVQGNMTSSVLGVQLMTNAFRTNDSTGAATKQTETVLIVKEGIEEDIPKEITLDELKFPKVQLLTGPICGWKANDCTNSSSSSSSSHIDNETLIINEEQEALLTKDILVEDGFDDSVFDDKSLECSPIPVPRLDVFDLAHNITPTSTPTIFSSAIPITSSPSTKKPIVPDVVFDDPPPTPDSGVPSSHAKGTTILQFCLCVTVMLPMMYDLL